MVQIKKSVQLEPSHPHIFIGLVFDNFVTNSFFVLRNFGNNCFTLFVNFAKFRSINFHNNESPPKYFYAKMGKEADFSIISSNLFTISRTRNQNFSVEIVQKITRKPVQYEKKPIVKVSVSYIKLANVSPDIVSNN